MVGGTGKDGKKEIDWMTLRGLNLSLAFIEHKSRLQKVFALITVLNMESSNSWDVFKTLNLNLQLFINEVLNLVDTLLDEAFGFFLQEALDMLKTEGTDRAFELNKGVVYLRDLVHLTMGKQMEKWQEYCLRFCFSVPEGISLTQANEPSGYGLPDLDILTDTELDAQLNSLRDQLILVEKESAELNEELRALKVQSLSSSQSAQLINEALLLYEKDNVPQMFQELTAIAPEFHEKLCNLKRKWAEEIPNDRTERLSTEQGSLLRMPCANGLFGVELKELEEFSDEITTSYLFSLQPGFPHWRCLKEDEGCQLLKSLQDSSPTMTTYGDQIGFLPLKMKKTI